MKIKRSGMTAIVGASGSGKSTIFQLLLKNYRPTSGTIYVNGLNLYSYPGKTLHEIISIVPQEPDLFDMSIRDNICLGFERYISIEEVVSAARMAHIHEYIISLPDGYDTIVGHRGSSLSGGQKQRIVLARAFIRNPEILLLDEATSALDTESESHIQQALEEISNETTVIVIAHRLATIRKADYVYVLKDGRVIEEGSPLELQHQNGLFTHMLKKQKSRFDIIA
jgi:ABC-type multidrug transport system fused ATPase/permease subunit